MKNLDGGNCRLPLPLVERSGKEISRAIVKRVKSIEKVKECRTPSIRMTGKRFSVVLPVSLDSNLGLEDTHRIAIDIERVVKSIVPNARIVIHTEPYRSDLENTWGLVKEIAEGVPGTRGVHNIHIQRIDGKLYIDLHLEVSAGMTVKQAHDVAEQVEKKIKAANHNITDITVHMESALDRISRESTGADTELKWYIEHIAKRFTEIKGVSGVKVRKIGNNLHVVLRCRFEPNLSMKKAHDLSNKLEKTIKAAYPQIARIDIHEEPI